MIQNPEFPPVIAKLIESYSMYNRAAIRYWIALALVSMVIIVPAEELGGKIKLPFDAGTFDKTDFYPLGLIFLSLLVICFGTAFSQSFRTASLLHRELNSLDNPYSFSPNIHLRDLVDGLVYPSLTRVAPLAQLLQGQDRFFHNPDKPSRFRASLSLLYYFLLKTIAIVVMYVLPFAATFTSFSRGILDQPADVILNIPVIVYWILLIAGWSIILLLFWEDLQFMARVLNRLWLVATKEPSSSTSTKKNNFMDNGKDQNPTPVDQVLWASIVLGIVATVLFLILFLFKTTPWISGYLSTEVWGHFGDVVGGFAGTIFSFAGVVLLIKTLKAQRRTFVEQQIETRFFEMMSLHKQNVNEMRYQKKSSRAVFVSLKGQLTSLATEIEAHYPQNEQPDGRNSDVSEWHNEVIKIAYIILFYGVDNSNNTFNKELIEEMAKRRGSEKAILDFYDSLAEEHKQTKEANKEIKKPLKKKNLKYDGQQVRLGHYFRQLYHTVKYINEKEVLSYERKYEYIRILKAQLSTHEQALLFFNSLIEVGLYWELAKSQENHKLITKYDLIRNMPKEFTWKVNPKHTYPDVYFQYDSEKTENKKKLIAQYS